MIQNLRFLLLLIPTFISSVHAQSSKDLDLIRQRMVNNIMSKPVSDKSVANLIANLKPDGSWKNINYIDTSRTGFQHTLHTVNLVTLAKAYKSSKSKYYKSVALKKTITNVLSFWVKNDFIAENWWYNQIGTPDNLVNLMLLAGDSLPKELVAKTQPIIMRGNLNAPGARPSGDRIKIGDISARQYLFLKDEAEFRKIVKVIENEIKFETGKGLQYDYSFHHREDRANNTLTYGLQFANVFADWAYYVKGTSYAFPQEKIKILIDYYLDGICKMMVFGKYPDVAACNRDLSRKGELDAMGSGAVEKLIGTSHYRKTDLQKILDARKNNTNPNLSHAKFFWLSEYFSQQRPKYFTSVRMYSTRNTNTEYPYNGEGLLNHHIGDGANYINTRGDEYHDIFPVWDWQKIPGTTVLQKDSLVPEKKVQMKGITSFVGGVTNGKEGTAAMDFVSPLDGTKAKKAWFFFNDFYICLGTGINSDKPEQVVTTINQTLSKGDVVMKNDYAETKFTKSDTSLNNLRWVYHDNVGYYFPVPQNVSLSNKLQKGSWYEINRQTSTSKAAVKTPVFKLWIDNGVMPENKQYSYVVFPSLTLPDFKKKIVEMSFDILENSVNVQAVRNRKEQLVQAVFYKPAKLRLSQRTDLEMQTPGAILLRLNEDKISEAFISDPGRNLEEISFSIIRQNKQPKIVKVKMPKEMYAGKSVQVKIFD